MLKTPLLNSFSRRNGALSDGLTEVDPALSETAHTDSIGNLFAGNPRLDSAQTDTAGVSSFMPDRSAGSAAPGVTATTPVDTGVGAISNAAAVVGAGATLELTSEYSGTVSFAGSTGTLKIDNSSSFSGAIAGQLAVGDVIDLADITYGPNTTIHYSGNNSPGTLTVSDGTHTASIALQGNYSPANFTAMSDGHGGTSVVDPPLPGQNDSMPIISPDALDHQFALFMQHMASALAPPAVNDGSHSAIGSAGLQDGQLSQFAPPAFHFDLHI